jgi:hypothetical protein
MFTVQVHSLEPAVMQAFANLFTELATKGSANRVETTATQYIASLDAPDVGANVIAQPLQATTTAAAVFGQIASSAVIAEAATGIAGMDPATVFGRTESPETATGVITQEQIAAAVANDPATVFASPNAPAASLPTVSDAAVVLDPAQNINHAPAPNGVMVDANGLPWDVRIHAGTRTQNKDGTWKKKKGVDDATVVAVEGELRAALAIPAKPFTPLNATVAPPPPPVTVQTVATPPAPPAPPAATAPATPAAPPAPPVASAAPTTFAELCKYVTGRAIPAPKILEICNKHGLAGLGLVAVRPDLIPAIYADFSAV